MIQIFQDADIKEQMEFRNRYRVPPGFKDGAKEINAAGDVIIWLTILKLAEEKLQTYCICFA